MTSKKSGKYGSMENRNNDNTNETATKGNNIIDEGLSMLHHPSDSKEIGGSVAPVKAKKKVMIEVDEDDPCLKQEEKSTIELKTVPQDPRFQQMDQTLRCKVMYEDFFRCEKILGVGHEACGWFQKVYTTICPNAWIEKWDELRETGRFAWPRSRGPYPSNRYGD